MAFEDTMRSLREFDINSLDFDNVGSWPLPVKVIIWVVLLVAVLAGGYYNHIEELQLQLASAASKEVELKKDFEKKAFQAANLEAYRQQMVEMEESFGALVSDLRVSRSTRGS
jgi:type IV pilus assembly protein PilO